MRLNSFELLTSYSYLLASLLVECEGQHDRVTANIGRARFGSELNLCSLNPPKALTLLDCALAKLPPSHHSFADTHARKRGVLQVASLPL